MEKRYSDEKHVQILVSLLKQHGISRVIASPGTTNSGFVTSLKYDGSFKIYSSVDERSAAYLACGLAAESGEPVVITCTGATASRNYMPGLTEAFYRKLPVLAVTGAQHYSKIGHHVAQVIDRTVVPNDVAKLSLSLPVVKDDTDRWDCEIKVNRAILELKRNGGGPAHLNLPTTYTHEYTTTTLPDYRKIDRVLSDSTFPVLDPGKRVAVFVGAHAAWSDAATTALDAFCSTNNAVVFCDHTSAYRGRYRVQYALAAGQSSYTIAKASRPDVLIHIGEISGDYASLSIRGTEVWRVSLDGELRDTFGTLTYVFEMSETAFFEKYTRSVRTDDAYLHFCQKRYREIYERIPGLPFSNIWVASVMADKIPGNSAIHFGILNSLRSWNYFELPGSVSSASNVGGFGIDGGLSSVIGASLYNPGKLYFCVIGDLAFFYDINVLGNRHVGKNVRILLINNGKGTEFRHFNHYAAQFGEAADEYIAAAGHFGNKSKDLVKSFVTNLGYTYLSAATKDEFMLAYPQFVDPQMQEAPVVFEVFTDSAEESKALELIVGIDEGETLDKAKQFAKKIVGERTFGIMKKMLKK
ncbi:MAG: hypothetical protein J7599_20030 [Niabella sp.]|nr:hypothetical protein [Niabella sp.]